MGYKRKALFPIRGVQEKKLKPTKTPAEIRLTDLYDRIRIESDGNCLFRAVQYFLTGSEYDYEEVRQEVCNFMSENQNFFSIYFASSKKFKCFSEYIDYMRQDGIWGDNLELYAASRMFNFNFTIFRSNSLEIHSHHLIEPTFKTLNLEYENGNHYNVLNPKIASSIFINLNKDSNDNLNNTKKTAQIELDSDEQNNLCNDGKLEKRKSLKPDRQRNLITKDSDFKEIGSESQRILRQNKPRVDMQDEKVENTDKPKLIKIQNSGSVPELYPLAKKGHNTYNEVYNFFRYQKRPERITKDSSFRYWRAEIARRYVLENKGTNNVSKSRLKVKMKDGSLKTIPFKEEITNIIEEAHNGYNNETIKHNGIKMTIRNLLGPNMSVYWADMSFDVNEYVNLCLQCATYKPINQIKITKTILPKGPFERFTADLWQIDEKLVKDSGKNYKYVLSCIDHFSKYKWTELIENKEAETVTARLEYIFNFFRAPKILQTDNGKEFDNPILNNMCKRKNVKLIHGSPYHPQSQGVVEKLNDLIAKSLHASHQAYKSKKEKKNWNIELALKAWTASSNQNVHSVTKRIPNKAIHIENEKEIKVVIENIKNYYERKTKTRAKKLDLRIGMKMFIIKEVQKVKNKQKLTTNAKNNLKKRTKKTKVRIPVEITDISTLENLFVKVRICGRPNEGMEIGEIYNIAITNLEIAKSEKTWKMLINN